MLRVLIVDDSTVYRSQIRAALVSEPALEIAGSMSSGRLALEWLKTNAVDVIILDLEMPEMSGLETLRVLRSTDQKTKVLVFSATTPASADLALRALRLGAQDVVAKPTLKPGDGTPADLIRRHLAPKIRQFESPESFAAVKSAAKDDAVPDATRLLKILPKVLVIGSSTGGPDALERLFALIAPPYACPILIVQHMPPVFTEILAGRLSRICGAEAGEAKEGELIRSNRIYVAPGDHHLRLSVTGGGVTIGLDASGAQRNFVRPAVDYLFETAAGIFGNACLGVVLTGMGSDGRDGALAVRKSGGAILIQNRASCVVFGMPGAVHDAGAFDAIGDVPQLAEHIIKLGLARRPPDAKGLSNAF